MTGPGTYASDADVAASARARLDEAVAVIGGFEAAQREAVGVLVGMWAQASWRAAGCTSAKAWLCAYTRLSESEAQRLESVAALCATHPALAAAVADGVLSVARAARLAKAVTRERAPYLDDACVAAFVALSRKPATDDASFGEAVRFWASKVDEIVEPRRVPPHALYLTERLFGGGDINGSLSPASFARVASGIEAFTQDPDPVDAPYRRSLGEQRADALDDLVSFAMTHRCDDDEDDGYCDERCYGDDGFWDGQRGCGDEADGAGRVPGAEAGGTASPEPDGGSDVLDLFDTGDNTPAGTDDDGTMWCGGEELVPDVDAEDTFDGVANVDELDAALDHPDLDDPLELLRRKIRRAEARRRRRRRRQVKPRSGVCVNVHIDLPTLLGVRAIDDFDGLVLHGDGWGLTRQAVEELTCDASLVATLFAGRNRILDANTAAERFNRQQRRAVAGRDQGCVFPGCGRHPRHCDLHHLEPRADGGPTTTSNAAMLCRFHHRLLHQHRWRLSLDTDGGWVATDPHDVDWKGRPSHQRAA